MTEPVHHLKSPPIVEAVLDIQCDLPPGFDLAALEESARAAFREQYPKFAPQIQQSMRIEAVPAGAPNVTTAQGLQALQFLHEDQKQLVQIRASGFAFNRLAPYSSLDTYLPEIARTWALFVTVAQPKLIRSIHLRYINRILLPLDSRGSVDLDDYLAQGPRLPDEDRLTFSGFISQSSAHDSATGHRVNITLAAQTPETDSLPIIFDIETIATGNIEPDDWAAIEIKMHSLRTLKNRVFQNSLTDKCLSLFQH